MTVAMYILYVRFFAFWLLYKVEKEREVFKELIHSENIFDYFMKMLKKDSLEYQTNHQKDIIDTPKKYLEQEKRSKITAEYKTKIRR